MLLGIGMPGSLELALICRRPVRGVEHNPIPRSGYATAYDNRKIVRWSTCEFVAGMRNLFISEGNGSALGAIFFQHGWSTIQDGFKNRRSWVR